MTKPTNTYATSVVESVEALTVLIELSGTDITADYGDCATSASPWHTNLVPMVSRFFTEFRLFTPIMTQK